MQFGQVFGGWTLTINRIPGSMAVPLLWRRSLCYGGGASPHNRGWVSRFGTTLEVILFGSILDHTNNFWFLLI
jgi:hypothetical protein